MKRIFAILIFVLLILNISSLEITEVELNPLGSDTGNEWVELYSKDEIDLEDYTLKNNDEGELDLEGSFQGYFLVEFEKQWLDNVDEKVYLYLEGDLIDSTRIMEDQKNDDDTWQLCDDDWELKKSTKKKKNSCRSEKEDSDDDAPQIVEDGGKEDEDILETGNVIVDFEVKEAILVENKVIKLEAKDIKTDSSKDSQEVLNKNNYATYGFIAFCVLLLILFLIRYKRFEKNEFI